MKEDIDPEKLEKVLLLPVGIKESDYEKVKKQYIKGLIEKGFSEEEAKKKWHREFIENYKKYGVNKKLEEARRIKQSSSKRKNFFQKLKELFKKNRRK